MKQLSVLILLSAFSAHANVKCLTSDRNSKIDIVEVASQEPTIQYYEKSGNNYALKFKEKVSVSENIAQLQVQIGGNQSRLVIKIAEVNDSVFNNQAAEFTLNNKKLSFNCDIENH